jgi:membrane-anchored glycerophosphoryl diester phosphodiesterase (GDPDase)
MPSPNQTRITVTDSTSWQPPVDTAGTLPPPSPFAGQAAGPGVPPPAGWTPPPKPGLIPLRPLAFGTILSASFQVLRRNPRPMFGFALLLTGVASLLTIIIVVAVTFFSVLRVQSATENDTPTIVAGVIAVSVLTVVVTALLSVIVSAILQGIVVLEVARGTLGEKLKLRGLWNAARGRIGALIGWALLVTGMVILGLVVLGTVIGVMIAVGGSAGVIGGVLLGFFGIAGAVVLGFWLATRLSFVPSVLVLERLPLRDAIRRSWSLSIGYFWKTLGIQLLVNAILQVVSNIISFPLQIVVALMGQIVTPNGELTAGFVPALIVYCATIVVTLVFGAIAAVIQSATVALIYIDIRMRKEGLDLDLRRFVEARQAGDSSVADPYLRRFDENPSTVVAATGSPWS